MGKYMKKANNSSKLTVMEVSQSPHGVLTRAKALALKRLQQSISHPPPSPPRSTSYLQLRNRRLLKHTLKQSCQQNPTAKVTSMMRRGSPASASGGSVSLSLPSVQNYQKHEDPALGVSDDSEKKDSADLGVEEASFGENVLDFECRERSTRESTPCNLIRDPDTIRTPSSTTRPTFSAEAITREQILSNIHLPTAQEMDDFFARAEEMQQRKFIEKYNFDPVNDMPLPGRYQWEALEA